MEKNNLWKYILGASALGTIVTLLSLPKVAENLKPLKNDRMQEGYGVYTDKETGKIYGFILGAGITVGVAYSLDTLTTN